MCYDEVTWLSPDRHQRTQALGRTLAGGPMVTRDEALHQTLGRTLAGEARITRDEALRRIRAQVEARYRLKSPPWQWAPQDEEKAAKHLDALEALGLIELAPAPIAAQVQLRADVLNCLQQIMTEVSQGPRHTEYIGHLNARGAQCILEGLEAVGFAVVRKGGRE